MPVCSLPCTWAVHSTCTCVHLCMHAHAHTHTHTDNAQVKNSIMPLIFLDDPMGLLQGGREHVAAKNTRMIGGNVLYGCVWMTPRAPVRCRVTRCAK